MKSNQNRERSLRKESELKEEFRESVNEVLIVFVRFLADVVLISALSLVIGASAMFLSGLFDSVEHVTHDVFLGTVLVAFHGLMLILHLCAAGWIGVRGLKRFVKRFR
ncbi:MULTISPECIES: hypothetical protein [unclassified Paraburkholderia]|uniref:hypothetical protein n=1 Tax=unclassified Paraburkholderia TaxID=2615204 RepID=UPI002AB15356|nr:MULTISPECIES: hypothetical protein [unclassified Paraburkholderia]